MASQAQEAQGLTNRTRIGIVLGLIAVAIILFAAFSNRNRGSIPIRTVTATREPIASSISTNGKIEPVNGFEAHAPMATSVKRLLVKEGDAVKTGQLLLELDDTAARAEAARAAAQLRAAQADLAALKTGGTHEEVLVNQADMSRAKAELESAQRSLETMKKLQQSGAASPAEVQDAQVRFNNAQNQLNLLQQKSTNRYSNPERDRVQAAVEQAQAAYSAAQDTLAKSNIRAPRQGTVYNLPVKAGSFVNPGDLLIQVAELDTMMVRAFVDEPDIGRLAQNQSVNVSWDALPGRTWHGTVTQVPTTVAVKGSRTVGELTCEVDNSDRKLLPNVNVSVLIVTAKNDNALTVPREVVHQDDGKRYLFQVVNDRLQRKYVETSISNLTKIEITKGISDGAVIALGSTNGQPMKDGATVRTQQ